MGGHTSRKLCHKPCKTLNKVFEATLPFHKSDKSLDKRVCFLFQIQLGDNFVPAGTKTDVHPPDWKSKQQIPACWIYGQSFSSTNAVIFYDNQLQLVNCSFIKGHIPDGFKTSVVTPLIKHASLPVDSLKILSPCIRP